MGEAAAAGLVRGESSSRARPPDGWIFRETSTLRAQSSLVTDVLEDIRSAEDAPRDHRPAAWLRAALTAGALECALADAGSPLAQPAQDVLDQVVAALGSGRDVPTAEISARLETWRDPTPLETRVAEGFAYYALWPWPFGAAAAEAVEGDGRPVTVVGIRTIGATLSAFVTAAIRARGGEAERITVRPRGEPYDRSLVLTPRERAVVDRARSRGATCLVVDEGPGLSGSTFLATAEALVACGVEPARICLFGTRAADVETLWAPAAASRWRRFRSATAAPVLWLRPGELDLSGGAWRRQLLRRGSVWPPAWPAVDRLKALAPDRGSLRKFEGLGRYGEACHRRAQRLSEAGLAPAPLSGPDRDGFVTYRWVPGRPLAGPVATAKRVAALARYCDARARALPADVTEGALAALGEMTLTNAALALGSPPSRLPALGVTRPVTADSRLQPHEWIETVEGRLIKTDGVSHGDDHFFPGPTDVAWDLAGTIIEWRLTERLRNVLLEEYAEVSGDDARARVAAYEIAYAAFRARTCVIAEQASPPEEGPRWRRLQATYERALRAAVRRIDVAAA